MTQLLSQPHPVYWFTDANTILHVEDTLFRIHGLLLSRQSGVIRGLLDRAAASSSAKERSQSGREGLGDGECTYAYINGVSSSDFTKLLEHVYHDEPLACADFSRISTILHITSASQLDFASIHRLAKRSLEALVPARANECKFTQDVLEEAVELCMLYDISSSTKKCLFYNLVTTSHHIHPHGEDPNDQATSIQPSSRLSPQTLKLAKHLLTNLINHFTPTLFTPPCTSHMACTDVFADKWMELAILPALSSEEGGGDGGGGVYKPLEQLERFKTGIDWEKHGLCRECYRDKQQEWTNEQEDIWELVGVWLG